MSEYRPSDIRVSDGEREDALAKLGEHMGQGRLDLDEYGERTAKVATAKTRGELLALFGDLPEPKPTFGQPSVGSRSPARREPSFVEKFTPVAVPVLVIIGVVALVLVTKSFFLLFFLFLAFGNSKKWRGGGPHGPHRMRHQWRDERG